MARHPADGVTVTASAPPDPTAIAEVRDVHQRFGAFEALRGVSFTLGPRQVIGLLGPNGAGKTTLLEILLGLQRPRSGEVRLFGEPLHPRRYPKRRVGAVFQRESWLEGMRVVDYARLYATAYDIPHGEATILERARLTTRAHSPIEALSGGEAQRLFLAASLVHEPELVLLDEPTAHLDPPSRADVGTAVRELARRATVLLATHDLHEAASVCDHVLFLAGGLLRAQGTPAELIASVPASARVHGGLADAFFHHCGVAIAPGGDGLAEAGPR